MRRTYGIDDDEPVNPWQQAWRLLAAAAFGVFAWLFVAGQLPVGATSPWLLVGDPLVALSCLLMAAWRRRYPLPVAIAVVIVSTASVMASGAALLVVASLATRRRWVETALVALACAGTGVLTGGLYPHRDGADPLWLSIALPTLVVGIAVAIGVAVGARREELRSLRERAESAEREQAARAAEARIVERHRIAREMHDVLAHRISLVAMQAGVLGHRTDLPAEEMAMLARGVADGSHQALEELRDVLGVLRANPAGPEPPQPSLADLPALVADAAALNLDVTLTDSTTQAPPEVVARTAYRIVQEGLTNAGKHASGARVRVTVEGAAGDGLRVTVRDSGATVASRPPASGFGLLGLAERVALAGGTLEHHRRPDGGFVLAARLPWPERSA